jgi:uncharacterized integral membrane protein (TIGR00698 family)
MTGIFQEIRLSGRAAELSKLNGWLAKMGPGLILAAVIAACGYFGEDLEATLIDHRIIEALVIAMVIGVAVRNVVALPEYVHPGAGYASKTILELAVLILGASIDVQTVFNAGFLLVVAVTSGVIFGLIASFSLGKSLGLETRLAFLVAVGNSICGNSAIAAVAPVVKAERREVASAIGLTAVAGVVVILILPIAVPAIGMNHYQYGIVAGMAVYAVPQVVAAAFAVSQVSGEVATLVKLMRVMFLGPVVMVTGLYMRARGGGDYQVKRSQLLPWFVIGFFGLLLLRSLGAIPGEFVQPIKDTGRVLTIWAMAGLGLGVDMSSIRNVGPRVGITSGLSMVLLVLLSILLITVLGLNG